MKNTTSYTVKEINEKWLPNAMEMYNFYMRKAVKGIRGAKASAAFWNKVVVEYTSIVNDPQNY